MEPRKITYILAEDEPPIRRNLIKKISALAEDFSLLGEASGGKRVLDLIISKQPQVVFTDIRMPGINGLELMEHLGSHYPGILIVVISGYSDFNYMQKSIRSGVTDYLLKPIDTAQLESTLNMLRQILKKQEELIDGKIERYEDRARKDLAIETADYIRKRFRENLMIQEIADNFHVNPTYLSRTFKENYGMTPSKFIQDQRISLAKRLLLQYPDMEVKEISSFIGYTNQNYFSRVFKKESGFSPLEYRQNGSFS